jgi:predicted P-loop ATPase
MLIAYQKMMDYINENYKFRFNTIKSRYEFKINGSDWTFVSDRAYNTIYNKILNQNIDADFQKMIKYIESEASPEYDPFKEWLNELPTYDIHNEPNYIQQLADTIEVDDCDIETRNDYFKRWFVSLYAQGTLQNCSQFLLVFIGSHGIGKDQFALSLLPNCLKEYNSGFDFMNIDKDSKLAMCNNLILTCAELEYMNRADQSKVKNIISINDFFLRASYGRVSQTYYRRCAFIGSANMESILADETGSRRYLVMRANNIKWQGIDDKLLERAYKQAQYIYDVLGYNFHFTQQEIAEVNEYNEQFRTTTLPEELIRMHFRIASEFEDGFTAGELLLKLMNYSNQMKEYHNTRLGAILKKLGYSQKVVKLGGASCRKYNIAENVNINQFSVNYTQN